uniref:6-pyruvoyl tetrahydrobiopterin synthase n=1 Tax=Phallusia mammillata TaxID=59560 RepID=A0A6F9DPE3_9ASCI|nr:6-pyruvoyl tetrahydrobiopterin synthase-like [Phallusia mammillata]
MDDSNEGPVYVSRKLCFSAGHRLHAKELSDEENKEIFGKCNHVHGHGHNYKVKVTVCGKKDQITGMVMNVVDLKDYMVKAIMDVMDHKFLDKDVDYFKTTPSTVENIAVFIWNQIVALMKNENASLYEVKVCETDNISAVYRG